MTSTTQDAELFDNELRRVCTYDLARVQSSRLRERGGPLEENELRAGIQEKLEGPQALRKNHKVIAFEPGDPKNPHNWSNVSCPRYPNI